MYYILNILLLLAVILEGTVTYLPLTLLVLLCLTIIKRENIVFVLAFFAGIFLDVLALRPVGGTSMFLLLFVFLLLLYQRKYEIDSYPFVLTAAFLGSIFFLLLFGYEEIFGHAIISAILGVILFSLLRLGLTIHIKK